MNSSGGPWKGEQHVTKTISIALSDPGQHTAFNFDNLYILDNYIRDTIPGNRETIAGKLYERSVVSTDATQLFAVFDGMGEGQLGVEASRIAAEILDTHRLRLMEQPEIPFKTFVRDFIREANDAICDRIRTHKGLRMGTTFSLLYLHDGIARTANIGNSRIFLFRGESLIQLTYDHTQAQKLVRMGIIGRDEAQAHPEKNVLTQYLGIFTEEMSLEPSFGPTVILQKKDAFLVTSNGLTDILDESTIREKLSASGVFSDLPHRLAKTATEMGSRDNLTLIAVRVMDTDMEQAMLVAGALSDVTTQIPAGEIDREAAAAIDLMDVGTFGASRPRPPLSGKSPQTAMSGGDSSKTWRILTPILIFLFFVLVGAGIAKIAFSWNDLFNRLTATSATTTLQSATTARPSTTAKPTTTKKPTTATVPVTTAAPTAAPTTTATTVATTTAEATTSTTATTGSTTIAETIASTSVSTTVATSATVATTATTPTGTTTTATTPTATPTANAG